MLETLQQLDSQLFLSLNSMNSPYWDQFMWIVSAKATWGGVYLSLLYLLCRNYSLRVILAGFTAIILCITLADQIGASLIRPAVERLRPANLDNPMSEFVHIVNGYRGGRYGFPSCHAANSFGLAFICIAIFRNRLLSLTLFCWALLNSYSRIYLGVHYPGDILSGMVLGFFCAMAAYSLWRYLLGREWFQFLLKASPDDLIRGRKALPFRHTIFTVYISLITVGATALYAGIVRIFF